jgi:predicted PurR-regulated permease PerM
VNARLVWVLVLVVLGAWLLWRLAPVLSPFLAGAIFAYLLNPIVVRLERHGLARSLAVALVLVVFVLLAVLLVLLAVPFIEAQIVRAAEAFPGYIAWLQERVLPWLKERFGLEIPAFEPAQALALLREHWSSAGGWLAALLGQAARSGAALLALLGTFVLTPVVMVYLLVDWPRVLIALDSLIPRRYAPEVRAMAREADEALSAFLRGQLLVMLTLAVLYSTALALIGLRSGVLIGLLAGLLSFVPYLGLILGLCAALIAAWIEIGSLWALLAVIAAFAAIQAFESFWLTPRLIGEKLGLHPLAVIFALLAGGQLLGFFGVLLALPAAAVLAVFLRRALRAYRSSRLYAAEE